MFKSVDRGVLGSNQSTLKNRFYSSGSRDSDKKGFDSNKFLYATYLSFGMGGLLLLAAIYRGVNKYINKLQGVEEVADSVFGSRPMMIKYKEVVLPIFTSKILKDIESFEVREDDVWVVSYPRSVSAKEVSIENRFPYLEYHYPGLKIIYIARNPKDFQGLMVHLKIFITNSSTTNDVHSVIKKIADFLGKSLSGNDVCKIAEHCQFNKMKNNEMVNFSWWKELGLIDAKSVTGDWKGQLTEEMNKRIDRMVILKFYGSGLEFQYQIDEGDIKMKILILTQRHQIEFCEDRYIYKE
ncbi:hypothetical protein KUTeg_006887 [Tegillarca granosa]|uniref:Sulfotransferase domain-containing protein n=1 Tax=Tegillarca granosa TaxID=220873 RepID=A0ABQ9FBM2_TEGGR|nr:hypothetical protein KUTeg_006887 [Tegillarca granosa]